MAADTLEKLTEIFRNTLELLRTDGCYNFVLVARLGFFAYARLRQHLQRLFDEKATEYLNILANEVDTKLNPNLQFKCDLIDLRDGKCSLNAIKEKYGHLSEHELEISYHRYWEYPTVLLELAKKIQGDPREELKKNKQYRKEILKQITTNLPRKEAIVLKREFEMARIYLGLRERVKFEYLKAYDLVRQILLKINDKLKWESGLIFHLFPEEVFDAKVLPQLKEIAFRRSIQYRENMSIYVPPVIDSRNLDTIGMAVLSNERVLKGFGATNHSTKGEVVVITNLKDEEARKLLGPGKVIVTITTDPAWTPLIATVGKTGGLITEVGGILAHGAIIAREQGIAAVLNVPNATKVLRTGMQVYVNGPEGYVEILS